MASPAKRMRTDPGKLPPEGGGGAGTEGAEQLSFAAGPDAPATAINRRDSYFKEQYVDTTWVDNFKVRLMPSSSDGKKFVFHINKLDGSQHMYLNRMKFFMRVQIRDKNNALPPADCTVAPVLSGGQAAVGRVRLTANGTTCMDTSEHTYPVTAYMGNLLNNGMDRKRGVLQREGHYEDEFRGEDGPYGSEWDVLKKGSGWDKRRSLFGDYLEGGTEFDYRADQYAHFNIPLQTEFRDTLPMVSRVGGVLEITLSEPGFYLQCDHQQVEACRASQYHYHVDHCHLKIPVKTMNPSQGLSLEKRMVREPAEFNNTRMDLGKFLIPEGVKSFNTDQIKSFAVCPSRIAFLMVPAYRLDGAYGPSALRSTPFFEKPWKPPTEAVKSWHAPALEDRVYLADAVLTINNQSVEDINPIDPIMLQDEMYDTLHDNLGLSESTRGIGLTREDFINGKFLLLYDLTKSGRGFLGGSVRQEVKQGSTKIALRFTDPLPCNVYLFAVAEYRSKVKVTASRTVYYSFLD